MMHLGNLESTQDATGYAVSPCSLEPSRACQAPTSRKQGQTLCCVNYCWLAIVFLCRKGFSVFRMILSSSFVNTDTDE